MGRARREKKWDGGRKRDKKRRGEERERRGGGCSKREGLRCQEVKYEASDVMERGEEDRQAECPGGRRPFARRLPRRACLLVYRLSTPLSLSPHCQRPSLPFVRLCQLGLLDSRTSPLPWSIVESG